MRVRVIIETELGNEIEVLREKDNFKVSGANWVSELYDLVDETVNQAKSAFRDVK